MTAAPEVAFPLPARDARHLLVEAGAALCGGAILLTLLAAGIASWFRLVPEFGFAPLALYLAIGAVVLCRVASFHPYRRFGIPNLVTLGRTIVICLFAGLIVAGPGPANPAADRIAWLFVGLAVAVLAMDGLDGIAARRQGLVSRFGARFDMEMDALFVLLLSILVWAASKAGAWVLLIGAMRYLFIAAGLAWPALAGPLPPSLRRKTVCVVQVAALCALLAPVIEPPLSAVVAALALAVLVYSFAVDALWLATGGTFRHPRGGRA